MNEERFSHANHLMSELLANPELFFERGAANELVDQFSLGYPLDNLRSLVRHPDRVVAKQGIWIASELPDEAPALLSDAGALLSHSDRYIRFYALDVIVLGTPRGDYEQYAHVINALGDPDSAVREHALFLLSRATDSQLAAARQCFESADPGSYHRRGLGLLAKARS